MMSVSTAARGKVKGREKSLNVIAAPANALLHITTITGSLLCILPLLLILGASFSTEKDIIEYGYTIVPRNFTLEAYRLLFTQTNTVGTIYMNTILSTLFGTLICVVSVGLYAYPLSRRDFEWTGAFTFYSFFTLLFDGGLVPYYILVRQVLNQSNSLWALFMPMGFSAFWVIVMRTFSKSNVPEEVVESARIDGAGEWRTLVQIVVPLAIPGLATVALFSVIAIWNNFFLCLLFNDNARYHNLQYFIYQTLVNIRFLKEAAASFGSSAGRLTNNLANMPSESFRMAMAIVTIGPIVLAYPFFQRFFIKGLTIGAVKG